MALRQGKGRVKLLRVNEVGSTFGAPNDQVVTEAVVQLEGEERLSFWFRVLDDKDLPVRQGYLDLLRDALNHGHVVNLDYEVEEGSTKGQVIRLWLTPAPARKPNLGGVVINQLAVDED